MTDHPGLYIHVPFCRSKCGYCSFYSSTDFHHIPRFLDALFAEMSLCKGAWGGFDTVYIGGGTPSVLPPDDLEKILTRTFGTFAIAANAEISLEANPADLNPDYLSALHRMRINRLNIGIQSFDDRILSFLGRRHDRGQAVSAIESARQAGYDNIGVDLIYGVPHQDVSSWMDDLSCAVSFAIPHLSCYQLTLEKNTPLGLRHEVGEFSLPDEEQQYALFMKTSEFLEGAGYIHYEVSNFASHLSFASRHNQKYWHHTPYLGLGPAAHSFSGGKRWSNYRSVTQYIRAMEEARRPAEMTETLTPDQLQLEALFLGLRTRAGVHLGDYKKRYGRDLLAEKGRVLAQLEKEGYIELTDGCVRPTRRGLAVADSLAIL